MTTYKIDCMGFSLRSYFSTDKPSVGTMCRHLSRIKEIEGMQAINIDVHNKREATLLTVTMKDAIVALAI
jgi:hypothetical protein